MQVPSHIMHPRPQSLHELSQTVLAGARFDPLLREFLDYFYVSDTVRRTSALLAEPLRLSALQDAYLAAVAEHLALRFRLDIPAWSDAPSRFLDQPFFAGGMESLKPLLLVESPLAFRRRLIFVSHDALSRPRDPDFLAMAQSAAGTNRSS